MTSIDKMTIEQLQRLIDDRIEARLHDLQDTVTADEAISPAFNWEQLKQDIERDRWTPPPGAKSSLELLRGDRER